MEERKTLKGLLRRLSGSSIANFVAILALAGAVFFNALQVRSEGQALATSARIASADYVLKLSHEEGAPKYDSIEQAISGDEYAKITSPGAQPRFTKSQVEDYIGNFETLGDLVQEGVIEKNMAYEEFSYDVTKAWCNHDVQAVVASDRATDPNQTGLEEYWYGFQQLSQYFMQKDGQTCKDYDKQ